MGVIGKNENNKKNRYDGVTIKYANELARKYSKLTLEEQKALHLIFSHVEPFKKNPTNFLINKIDFFEKLNLKGDDKYKRYKLIANSLILKTFIEIDNDQVNSKGVVIYNVEWRKKEPYFEVSLNPKFMPYLEEFINYYTKIDLDSFVSFRSKHALTLYKFFCSWNSEKKTIQTTKQLKELLGLNEDSYVQNGKFNRAAWERDTINKAINEINNVSNLQVNYKKNKKHNKVQNYEFYWKEKNKIGLNSDKIILKTQNEVILDQHQKNVSK